MYILNTAKNSTRDNLFSATEVHTHKHGVVLDIWDETISFIFDKQ